ncbi:nucleotide sugar dehydrogenase [Arthrobacter sp. LAPM80]|uniref:nucleotide sugar dehydrogenase n=1 Tax=Arthrobacter sp. LAPM80 TaxID=3141788 RepID=UPI00398A8197
MTQPKEVSIVGLGTVGQALACAMLAAGYRVTGIDLNVDRQNDLLRFACASSASQRLVVGLRPLPSRNHIIAVATPLRVKDKVGDLRSLVSASRAIGTVLRPGDLVVVRSTVPVGTVRNIVSGELSDSSRLASDEFHLAYAPERCVVGDEAREIATLPQLVGAIDSEAALRAHDLFASVTGPVISMQAVEAAELAKLANNAYNDLRHAFSNQIAMIAERYNLDAVRLIDEANRDYPRDPMVRPSPGVGGSCLTKDPYLLAQSLDEPSLPNLFTVGRNVNDRIVADIITLAVEFSNIHTTDTRVLVCGAAFKGHPPTQDTRGSVGVLVANQLRDYGMSVAVHDPCVTEQQIFDLGLSPHPELFDGSRFDIVLLIGSHSYYEDKLVGSEVRQLLKSPSLVYDPWSFIDPNVLRRDSPNVTYASIGFRSTPATAAVSHAPPE